MNIKQIAATALALALGLLSGCGGGGGSPAAPSGGGATTVLNSGIYLDTANDLALAVLPEQSSRRAWYGLRLTSSAPVIYRGEWAAASASARSFVGASRYDGSASWTAAATTRLTGSLLITPTDLSTNVMANQVTGLSVANLNNSLWQGTWTLNAESAAYGAGQALALSAAGTALSATITRFLGCSVSAVLTTRAEPGLYDAVLTFANDALDTTRTCSITVPMSGLLMAYGSGSSKYLRLVAFDSGDTQSVSFRAVLP